MALIRQVLELLLSPFFLCVLLLCITSYFLWRGRHLTYLKWANVLLCITLLIISTGWLPWYLTSQLEFQYKPIMHPNPNIRYVVVLGGGKNVQEGMPENDALTSSSIKRLVEGVRLFRLLPKAHLVLAGGDTQENQSEAALMSQLALWFFIPKDKIVLESNSINTADQARLLASIVHDEPFYLVTSATHMPRVMALCLQQKLHPIAAPTDFTLYWSWDEKKKILIPNAHNLHFLAISMHEYLGILWAKLSYRFHAN